LEVMTGYANDDASEHPMYPYSWNWPASWMALEVGLEKEGDGA
jgi:hypothetical protein